MSKATNVPAVQITGQDLYERVKRTPGAFYFYRTETIEKAGIIHSCPCGCRDVRNLPLKAFGRGVHWTRTGPDEAMTLSPSVGMRPYGDQDVEADGFHWHGWLKAGVWVSC